MNIIDYIGTGKDHATSRKTLVKSTGKSDRAVRSMIACARASGHIICNLQDGAGYYIPNDANDIKSQFLINQSRALAILSQQQPLRKKLTEMGVKL